MRKVNRLSFADKLRAIDWLRAAAERLQAQRPTFVQMAQELTQALGVVIAGGTASDLCAAAGVVWELPVNGMAKPNFMAVEKRLREAEAELARLRGWLRLLYERLGERMPAGLLLNEAKDTAVILPTTCGGNHG